MKNIKKLFNLIILGTFVVSVIYFIVLLIFFPSSENILATKTITSEYVEIYLESENLVLTDYSLFYSLEKNIQNLIETMNSGEFSQISKILDTELAKSSNNITDSLKTYYESNFKYERDEASFSGYVNANNLVRVYKVDAYNYICEVKTINENNTKIGIRLSEMNTYKISYLKF